MKSAGRELRTPNTLVFGGVRHVREWNNGTVFLWRSPKGNLHLCQICSNLPDDRRWKARRFTDGKYFTPEKVGGEVCFVFWAEPEVCR